MNPIALLIVISGTLGAALLSVPFSQFRAVLHVAWNSYRIRPATAGEVVQTLIDLSLRSRTDSLVALQKVERRTEVTYLKSALGMLVDGYDREEIREILAKETYFFHRRRQQHERVFRHMARLAPAFGVAGSVIGLIGMLTGLGDTAVILETIPLALTSTLYGIVLCNFVFTPIAENIHFKTQREMLVHTLIFDGIAAIQQEPNSHKLERRLTSFLTPAARRVNQHSFEEIRRRYRQVNLGEGAAGG